MTASCGPGIADDATTIIIIVNSIKAANNIFFEIPNYGNLSIDAGPFTIIGIPMPPKVKKYVAADLINATLSGKGSVGIDGSYNAREDTTDWSGGGDLTGRG